MEQAAAAIGTAALPSESFGVIRASSEAFVDAGEEIRYESRRQLATVALPGSGDFYVFDDEVALFLHYAGNGTNTAFEATDDPTTVQACVQAFSTVWSMATPVRDYRPE